MPIRAGQSTVGPGADREVQRHGGVTHKVQIEEMGIKKFNDACRASGPN